MKTCTQCHQEKQLSEFYKNSSRSDGYSNQCKSCEKERKAKSYLENREQILKQQKIYKTENPDKISVNSRKYYENNKELVLVRSKNSYENNKEVRLKQIKEWKSNNKGKVNAKTARRNATRVNATPNWLNEVHRMQIQWFYLAAKMMTETSGVQHEVDHIHALRGKDFTGLHVPWNLQCVPQEVNRKKSNKLPLEAANV